MSGRDFQTGTVPITLAASSETRVSIHSNKVTVGSLGALRCWWAAWVTRKATGCAEFHRPAALPPFANDYFSEVVFCSTS